MHAFELVQLAALVASHGDVLVRGAKRLSGSSVRNYWTASKCRLDRWAHFLGTTKPGRQPPPGRHDLAHPASILPWLEEILTGEVLTRIWTGVVGGFEQRHQLEEAEPLLRNVLIGHLEARHKTLQLLVSGRCVTPHQAAALNQLRRRTECWTDMLLGYLMPLHDVSDLAFRPERVRDFAEELADHRRNVCDLHAWPLVLSSLRSAFLPALQRQSPNADLNQRIASSVLACFGPDLFDSTGLFPSLWQIRLANTTTDTLGMIDQLLVDASMGPSDEPRRGYSGN